MYTASVETELGSLVLTQNEAQWQLVSIVGLNPPNAQINTTTIAGMDGAKFNSSKLNTRNLVLTIRINGNVDSNRMLLYRMFRTKELVTFYYQHNSIDVMARGYVDTCTCDIFKKGEQMQVSIICPFPYWQSVDEIISDISNSQPSFTFPFTINSGEPVVISSYVSDRQTVVYNDTDTDTGMTIEIDFKNGVEEFFLANGNGEYFGLDEAFVTGDKVIVNTVKGQKNVQLVRDGETTGLFGALQPGSTFFQLKPGVNRFWYECDGGMTDSAVSVVLKYRKQYRGV